jgi:acetyl coenzyme A synthetase (ADP forming)-like protein
MSRASLDAVFRPRSVAVIGASRHPTSIGREIIRNLIDFEYTGKVFPVNPKATVVHSMKCYPRVSAIPDAIDLAVIVVPRAQVPGVLAECGRKGIKGVVTITAGFREVGPEGAALEAKVKSIVKRYQMRMVGPNCMGVINTSPDVRLNATFAGARPERGGAAFVSQSGALGEAILANARSLALGIAMFVSMGNKTDVSGNDLLEYWEHDPDVRLILMYLESFGNPERFIRLARRISRVKPILTVKSGRSEAGARAASSHTGSIVGRDIAVESLLEQSGVLRVSTMGELFTLAASFALQPIPKGDRVGIVTNAGGPGILATDTCVAQGLTLPELSARVRAQLRKILPPEASTGNPVDLIASATPERFEAALRVVLADPGLDSVIAIFVSPVIVNPLEMARAIARAARGTKKTIVSCFMGKEGAEGAEGTAVLRAAGIPAYRFPEEAALALGAMNRYRLLRDRPVGKVPACAIDRARAHAAIAAAGPGGWLSGSQAQALLEAAGLAFAPSRIVRGAAAAIAAAHKLGYPVVLKAESDKLLHKSDAGGVKVDLRNADEVVSAFEEMETRLHKVDPRLRVKVQSMIRGGREVILGMTRDPQYGPLLMFGLGGIHVEVLRDVAVRVHPITDVQAREMIRSIRGYPLLAGTRGERPADLGVIESSLLRLSALVAEFDVIEEVDINPLIVSSKRGGSLIVDARVRVRVS